MPKSPGRFRNGEGASKFSREIRELGMLVRLHAHASPGLSG